jgi:hypothetical protein
VSHISEENLAMRIRIVVFRRATLAMQSAWTSSRMNSVSTSFSRARIRVQVQVQVQVRVPKERPGYRAAN